MRHAPSWLSIALVLGLAACADEGAPGDASGASADAGTAHDGGAAGGSDAAAALDATSSPDASDDASGASSDAAAALDAAFTDGGASSDASSSADRAPPGGKISCDPQAVLCDVVEPTCPENKVPSVQGGCFGPCVDIDDCSCSDAPECPKPETYTCHRSAQRCGPYVN